MLIYISIFSPAEQLNHLTPMMTFLAGVDWILERLVNILNPGATVNSLVKRSRRYCGKPRKASAGVIDHAHTIKVETAGSASDVITDFVLV
jgi:hypothetical protein